MRHAQGECRVEAPVDWTSARLHEQSGARRVLGGLGRVDGVAQVATLGLIHSHIGVAQQVSLVGAMRRMQGNADTANTQPAFRSIKCFPRSLAVCRRTSSLGIMPQLLPGSI